MVRALTACALFLAVGTASSQNNGPPANRFPAPQPTVAASGPNVSACDKHACSAPAAEATAEKQAHDQALLRQKLAELNCLQSEIEALRAATGTPQQILVKVKAVEVSRTKLRKLGVDLTTFRTGKSVPVPQLYTPPKPAGGAGLEFGTFDDSNAVLGWIDALRKNNIARVLAEPSIAVVSGRPAQLHVGGEFPMPTAPGNSQPVEFKSFGAQMDVLATALGNDVVRLDLQPRICEIDRGHEIEINGVRVPGLSVRQIDTSLDLKFGQTGVLSGMVQQRTERRVTESGTVDVVNEIELLFLVTPEVIASADITRQDPPQDASLYRTATSECEDRPAERSLRVAPRKAR